MTEERNKLLELREKVANLSEKESQLRDLYLKKLANSEIQGPVTGYSSLDKPWLKYYNGQQICSSMPKKTLYEYMIERNRKFGDQTALYYFNSTLTFKEFDEKINTCCVSLIKSGIKENDIVTLCMPNTPEALIMFYALNKIGAVANMVHPLSSENEIKDFINEVNSKMVVTIDSTYNKVMNIKNQTNLTNIVLVSPSDSMVFPMKQLYDLTQKDIKLKKDKYTISWKKFMTIGENSDIKVPDREYESDKTTVILHTGGTTGKSKGVELTDDNFNSMVEQFMLNADNFARGDKMLAVMPVFHGFGLCSSIHLPLSRGVGVILIPKIDINNIDKLFIKHKPNHLLGVPTLFKGIMSVITKKIEQGKLKDFDLSYLKYAVSGGDTVKDNFEEEINKFFVKYGSNAKLAKGYGLSEVVAGATFAYDNYNKFNSVGIPMIKTSIKIVDPETKEELNDDEIGEICVQGPTVMKGYYKNETESKNTLIDTWLHTGDMGYFDEGLLYFSQRKGNMIISSGINVYPKEIEEIIEKHPAVNSCAVIGIYHPYKTEVPKAYIVLKEGCEMTEEIKSEIDDLCVKNLNKYSIPYAYEFRESLPQTLLGKISHKQLADEEKSKTLKK